MFKKINIILAFVFCLLAFNLNAQTWKAIPLVSQKILNTGNTGGEGCQWPQAIEVDHTDGSFLLFGTDVGGIYRSTNSGLNWEPCNIDYNPRGNCGFAIDPNNKNRALAVGGNSTSNQSHGLYLTTDMGASWNHVLPISNYDGYRGYKDKVAFVKGSFDSEKQASQIAYWSNPSGGIYKSENGGQTWTKVNSESGDCVLKVHPDSGFVYVANLNGFYKSTDGGKTFVKKIEAAVRDIDVILTEQNSVYLTTSNTLYKSVDGGNNFVKINVTGYPANVVTLKVSPANPLRIAICDSEGDYTKPAYFSDDGGATWKKSQFDNSNAFMPFNGRTHKFCWHPTNDGKIWAFGGDWITSSSNGGKNFKWDANGYNGVLVGGMINFNVFNPDLVYVASQDYNGAFTKDGGKSWNYCNASNLGWGGFTYAAYAASDKVLVTMVAPEWHQPGPIAVSRNGGGSFTKTNLICSGLETACGDAKDTAVIYFREYYSKDLGNTWQKMNGCNGVFIANLSGEKEVYGANGKAVVKSTDKGDTWQTVANLPENVLDIAINPVKSRIFVVTNGNRIFRIEKSKTEELSSKIPADQYNSKAIKSVAVDINNPSIVFCAGPKNTYKTDASVKRSSDGGNTWEIITPNNRTNSGITTGDGANEVFGVRVNPKTRDLWCTGGCYGIWKMIPENKMTLNISGIKSDSIYNAPLNLTLVADVKQNSGTVSTIEFYNGDIKIDEVNNAPFEFHWNDVSYGDYQIYARVTDSEGNVAFSNVLPAKVRASVVPEVSIVSPANNAIFDYNSTIEIKVIASDSDGTITKVEFFNGLEKLGEDTDSAYTFSWTNVLEGTYQITAKATDNSNQTVRSEPVTVTVRAEGGKLIYLEDFNDGLAQNWAPSSGTWAVTDSQYFHSSANGVFNCIYNGSTFSDFTFSAKIKSEWDNNFGLIFNYQNEQNYYLVELDASPSTASLKRIKGGAESTLKQTTYNGSGGNVFYLAEVINNGQETTIKVDGQIIMENIATTDFIYGKIGLYAWWNKIWYDNVSVSATTDVPVEEYVTTCDNQPYFGLTKTGRYIRKGETEDGVETLFITNLTVLPTFKITENKEVCQGENYLGWTETDTYVQELLATSGCDSIVTTNLVVYELPQKPEIEADGDTLTCSVSGNYFWYRNDSLLKSNNTKSIVIEESGNYKVQVSNEKGCLSGFSESVFVVKTSAGSNYSADIFNIYPNPVSGTSFTVKSTSPDFKTAVIKIYNSAGILIYSDVMEKNKTTIPTSKLAARGLFIVTYQVGSLMEIKKLILN
jgi:photosystem II stability/assembly factor-like uncharacterized protein